jgi:hypothetical protein
MIEHGGNGFLIKICLNSNHITDNVANRGSERGNCGNAVLRLERTMQARSLGFLRSVI